MPTDINEAPLEGPEGDPNETSTPDAIDWLGMAKEAHKTSTDYLDSNYRKQFEKNISNFRLKHPPGSKYYTDAYKSRSRLFRPKIRTAVRNAEATLAENLFGNREVFSVKPINQADRGNTAFSEFWEAVLNFRLTFSMPWYLVAMGAFQETKNYGIVVSKQYWHDNGHPYVDILPVENCRFDPGASWLDPVNTSPYWEELIPMYVDDVISMTREDDEIYRWIRYSRDEIIATGKTTETTKETIRTAREGDKQDPKDPPGSSRFFQIVWVHRNFIKVNDIDYEFYTLGTQKMLSEPVPVTPETHPLGRNYRVGISTIETHRVVPAGDTELGGDLQSEANDGCNQRIDNVRLVLNKGYFVHTGAKADLVSLRRSYPGRIVMHEGSAGMIEPDVTSDVTGSAYAEQDRINSDIDDLMGGFSSGSVATNRAMNETVGGMKMINQTGNKVQAYSNRTFVETWVEPVLSDMVILEQAYEKDDVLMLFAGENAQQIPKFRATKMAASVIVGLGSLDPEQRAIAFMQSLMAFSKVAPWQMAKLDSKQVANELFGVIGYREGQRFFTEYIEMPQQTGDPSAELKAQEIKMRQEGLVMDKQRIMAELQLKREIEMAKLALQENMTMQQLQARLELDMDKHNLNILKELGQQEKIQKDREEMQLKMAMGSGI